MNGTLWVAQTLLALLFLGGGWMKLVQYDKANAMWPWVKHYSRSFVAFVGVMDALAGVGVVLPWLTGLAPWLTPLAALGGAVILALAVTLHLRRGETKDAGMNLAFLALAVFVTVGRFV